MNSFCMHLVWDSSHEIAPAAQTQFLSHVFVLFLRLWFMCFFSSLNSCASTEHSTVIQGSNSSASLAPMMQVPGIFLRNRLSNLCLDAPCSLQFQDVLCMWTQWNDVTCRFSGQCQTYSFCLLSSMPYLRWFEVFFWDQLVSWDSLVAEYVVGMVGPTCPIKKHIHSHTFTRW